MTLKFSLHNAFWEGDGLYSTSQASFEDIHKAIVCYNEVVKSSAFIEAFNDSNILYDRLKAHRRCIEQGFLSTLCCFEVVLERRYKMAVLL